MGPEASGWVWSQVGQEVGSGDAGADGAGAGVAVGGSSAWVMAWLRVNLLFFFLQMLILNLIEERGVRRRRWLEMEVASEGLKRWDKEK